MRTKSLRIFQSRQHGLGHPIVQERQERGTIGRRKRRVAARRDTKTDATLNAVDRGETTVPRDVSRLRRPGRDRSGARNDNEQLAPIGISVVAWAVSQQALECCELDWREATLNFDEMPIRGRDRGDGVVRTGSRERGFELGDAEWRQRVTPAKRRLVRHVRRGGRKAGFYSDSADSLAGSEMPARLTASIRSASSIAPDTSFVAFALLDQVDGRLLSQLRMAIRVNPQGASMRFSSFLSGGAQPK